MKKSKQVGFICLRGMEMKELFISIAVVSAFCIPATVYCSSQYWAKTYGTIEDDSVSSSSKFLMVVIS